MPLIAGRPVGLVARSALDLAHLSGLARGLRTYRRPFRSTLRYASAAGAYPWTARVRTPLGEHDVRCRSWHDVVTIHEVFARNDYGCGFAPATMLDGGANIGVTALWALTRRPDSRVHCLEPVEPNIAELRRNLSGFEDRYELEAAAVAAESGQAPFGIEQSGRYGGLGLGLSAQITVAVRGIAELIDERVEEWGGIDLLKLDVEGAELEILAGLDAARLSRLGAIAVEHPGELPAELYPPGFAYHRHLDVHHFSARARS